MAKPRHVPASQQSAGSEFSDNDQYELQKILGLIKRNQDKKVQSDFEKFYRHEEKKVEAAVNKHTHLMKTHKQEMSDLYTQIVADVGEKEAELAELVGELEGVLKKHKEICKVFEKMKKAIQDRQITAEGCLSAFQDLCQEEKSVMYTQTSGLIGARFVDPPSSQQTGDESETDSEAESGGMEMDEEEEGSGSEGSESGSESGDEDEDGMEVD